MTEDEMVGWHHQLDGHEFEQALGVGDGQPSMLQSMVSQRVRHDRATELMTNSQPIPFSAVKAESKERPEVKHQCSSPTFPQVSNDPLLKGSSF